MRFVGTGTRSAQPCHSASPATRVPSSGPLPSAARRTTTPATSCPGIHSSRVATSVSSPRLTAKARTSTSASSGAGSGSGTSSRSSVRVGPLGVEKTARIHRTLSIGNGADATSVRSR